VRYREWEEGKRLRQPVYLELRSDLSPHDCKVPARLVSPSLAALQSSDSPSEPASASSDPTLATSEPTLATSAPTFTTSNLDKIFWPAEGYTKGDLLDYYQVIAPWLLPYLRDRPLVITRYPDGIEGKSFFQRDAPTWIPSWFQTQSVWSKESGREVRCFVCNDLESLLYLVNLGTIPLHLWSSRITDMDRPDWCILDLDPKGAPWKQVQACASAIHKLCNEIGLPCYLKTSGSSGLHVLLPLGAQCSHAESRDLANILVRVVESQLGDIATTERNIARRGGKVYLDWLQNRHGQLLCAPLSARALPGAPVSMPMRWRELKKCRGSRQYTIASAPRRMRRLREDPMLGVLTESPDLLSALVKLKEKLA
jgi:bifunctional non-homologous end joining protein LigD